MAKITMIWDEAAVRMLPAQPQVQAALDRLAGRAVNTMKALCPVSPAGPRNPPPGRPSWRAAGDFPLPPSGRLRSSIHALRMPDGSVIVGPTVPYAMYVEEDTRPHVIAAHGPWSLRSRVTGQLFGPVVHHPGTRGQHFVRRTAETLGGRERL